MTVEQKKELIELVKIEAKNLRESATAEELERLDLEQLYPNNTAHCIYGQMTHDCYNKRANSLIKACANKVYFTPSGPISECKGPIESFKRKNRHYYFSPIELYITKSFSKKKKLINYLKGVTNKLEL